MANSIDMRTMAEVEVSLTSNLNDLNEAIKQNDMRSVEECKAKVQNDIIASNQRKDEVIFKEITESDDPMHTAIKFDDYDVKKLEEEHDGQGIIVSYAIKDGKRRLDFVALDAYCKKRGIKFACNDMWQGFAKAYALLWNLKNEKDIGGLPKYALDTQLIKEAKRDMELDKDPVSNANMVKALQKLVDAMYYTDKDGKNAYKVTTHDTNYIHKVITGAGKARCSLRAIREVTIIKYLPDVLYHLVFNVPYSAEKSEKKA